MPLNKRPIIIGITGSIGSGKTTVCKIISDKHKVHYADELAHQALSHEDVFKAIISRWGLKVIKNDNVDRKAIAKIVFENKDELDFLNSIVHPKVLKLMQNLVDESYEHIICFEVPLLFEANLRKCFDYVILVTASYQFRLFRLKDRSYLSQKDIQNRLDSQFDDEKKAEMSDLVIPNNGTLADLRDKVAYLLEQFPMLTFKDVEPFS